MVNETDNFVRLEKGIFIFTCERAYSEAYAGDINDMLTEIMERYFNVLVICLKTQSRNDFTIFLLEKLKNTLVLYFTFLTWNNSKWITKLVLCYIICFLTQFLLREYLWWFNCCVKICTMHLQAPLTSECFYVIISSSSLLSPLFVRLSLKAKCIAMQPVRYIKLCIIRSSGHESFGLLYGKNEVSTWHRTYLSFLLLHSFRWKV